MTAVPFLRRWLPPAAVAVAALGVAACGKPQATKPTNSATTATIGAALYVALPAQPVTPSAVRPDDIVATGGVVQFDETITLSAEVDGKLELVATPLAPNTAYDPKDPQYAGRLMEHPRDATWMHVRLVDGDPIKKGQQLASLDDSQAILDKESLKKSMEAAEGALKQSQAAVKDYADVMKKINDLPSASELEKTRYRIEYVQAKVTEARLNQEFVKLAGDFDKATDRKRRHVIRSEFDGKVVRVLRPRGVVVKAGEPILEVQNTGRFRVEVKVDTEVADRLKPYLPVGVEPVRAVSPEPYSARHRQEVTGVAVYTVGDAGKTRPVVVSASADGTALVWDALGEKRAQHVLPHPSGTGVRCVAVVARGDARWVATGGSDGKVRLWDVSDLGNLPTKPAHEFEEAHGQGVGAAAFSPDGQFLATAAGRDVFVWDAAGRKKKYALPAEHRDEVKAVRFTPQATLVTVCRDRSIRVWELGTEGAKLVRTLDHRSGAVDVLDVSADGGRVLFDQDAGRIDLVSLAEERTTGSLLNGGGGVRFSGMALFSPDGKLVLTGAGDADAKGELQLWAAPDSGRGAERKRLATPGRAAVTCAAFSPDPGQRFVAVGTQSGVVQFWILPPLAEQAALTGKLVSITRTDARTALLRVEVENPGGKLDDQLQDRGTATLIFNPNDKPAPPVLPAAPLAPAGPGALVPPVAPIGRTAGK